MSGEVLGTPSYMPPEQALGRVSEMGPLVDVYALGAVLYALLTGRPPFQAPTPAETLRLVQDQEPVPPRRLNAGVPKALQTICLHCLEKAPRGATPAPPRWPTTSAVSSTTSRSWRSPPVRWSAPPSGSSVIPSSRRCSP